jgi:hypothetical protein
MSDQRQRLRFEAITVEVTPSGHCKVAVSLEWDGRVVEGTAQRLDTHQGRIQAAAGAAGEGIQFEIAGVKSVRAFDGWVVIMRVNATVGPANHRLLGSAACEKEAELPRTAALALLDASNRLLARHVDT